MARSYFRLVHDTCGNVWPKRKVRAKRVIRASFLFFSTDLNNSARGEASKNLENWSRIQHLHHIWSLCEGKNDLRSRRIFGIDPRSGQNLLLCKVPAGLEKVMKAETIRV